MFERSVPSEPDASAPLSADEFQRAFGEELSRTLDLSTWRAATDLSEEYERLESEVHEAIAHEDTLQEGIRRIIFPKLKTRNNAPKNAGVHAAERADLEKVHRDLLFNGGVEACNGKLHAHETLPLTIYQIGVSLVSYQGNQATFCQRLFRRDLREKTGNPIEDTLRVLEGRARAAKDERAGKLIQKTLLEYAQRAILLHRSNSVWRMGTGHPVTYELLTGGGNLDLMEACINLARDLIEGHGKFVFVGSEPRDRDLVTIGYALPPYHFAIVATLAERIKYWLHQARFAADETRKLLWSGEPMAASEWIPRFIQTVAPKVVVGLFRASSVAPAHLFYAHRDHADVAAHIAIADGMLHEQTGSPLLLQLARHLGDVVFGNTLETLAESAYSSAGVPWRYRPIRST
jgi:hypothetical protein